MGENKNDWVPGCGITIDEYLRKRKPSLVTSNEADWIWVRSGEGRDPDIVAIQEKEEAEALRRGMEIVGDLMSKLQKIEKDDSIPVRAKKGQKSKKAVRDEAHAEAAAQLKKVSLDSGSTGGKWILFPQHSSVDKIWGQIARSVAHGPLRDAGVKTAKVAPTEYGAEERPHLICVYFDNVYDLDEARKILTVLLTEHGIEPNSVKSDLYTLIGIDSNHPSKLRSTIWRPNEVIEGGADAIKALKDKYSASKEAAHNKAAAAAAENGDTKKPAETPIVAPESEKPTSTSSIKSQTKSDKSVKFATSEKQNKEVEKRKEPMTGSDEKPIKRVKTAAMKYKENDIFADSDDE